MDIIKSALWIILPIGFLILYYYDEKSNKIVEEEIQSIIFLKLVG